VYTVQCTQIYGFYYYICWSILQSVPYHIGLSPSINAKIFILEMIHSFIFFISRLKSQFRAKNDLIWCGTPCTSNLMWDTLYFTRYTYNFQSLLYNLKLNTDMFGKCKTKYFLKMDCVQNISNVLFIYQVSCSILKYLSDQGWN